MKDAQQRKRTITKGIGGNQGQQMVLFQALHFM